MCFSLWGRTRARVGASIYVPLFIEWISHCVNDVWAGIHSGRWVIERPNITWENFSNEKMETLMSMEEMRAQLEQLEQEESEIDDQLGQVIKQQPDLLVKGTGFSSYQRYLVFILFVQIIEVFFIFSFSRRTICLCRRYLAYCRCEWLLLGRRRVRGTMSNWAWLENRAWFERRIELGRSHF